MIPARKYPAPANDHSQRPRAVTYVVLAAPKSPAKSRLPFLSFVISVLALLLAWPSSPPSYEPPPIVVTPVTDNVEPKPADSVAPPAETQKPQQPFDITVDASELAPPPASVAAIAEKLPPDALTPRRALPPVLKITVDKIKPARDEAALKAASARAEADAGNLDKALQLQRQAVELKPRDMSYRFDLAVLFDRTGDGKSAAPLYQEIMEAYDRGDATLPPALDVAAIRRRSEYLMSSAAPQKD